MGSANTEQAWAGKLTRSDILITPAPPPRSPGTTTGGAPVAHWKLDECSGNTVKSDTIPYNPSLDGTITITNGTAGTCRSGNTSEAWNNGTSGKFNASLDFNGDDYVTVARSSLLEPETAVSVSAWVKSASPGNAKYIISKYYDEQNESSYGFTTVGNGLAFGYLGQSNAFQTSANAGTGIWNNTWHHIVGVATFGTSLKLYVDGKQTGDTVVPSGVINYTTGNLFFGTKDGQDIGYYSGLLDDVQIYNYALTESQIRTIYNRNSAVRFGQ